MRKVLAIVLALVMAYGCTAIAFAADYVCPGCNRDQGSASEFNTHIAVCAQYKKYASDLTSTTAKEDATQYKNTCPYCEREFSSEKSYNDHIAICAGQANNGANFANITIVDVINSLFDAFKVNNDWLTAVSGILTRIMDLIEKIGTSLVGKADVAGAIDDLEAKVAELPIVGDVLEYIHNLITTLKQKVKDLYAHDAETAAVAPVDTGSTSVGIAAFAAVSVAAAAAFVCTKKKEN